MRVTDPIGILVFILVAALTVAASPSAGAQSGGGDAVNTTSDVSFWGHVFGHGAAAPMPANTEFPAGEANYGLGTFHWCTSHGEQVGFFPNPNPDRNCDDSYVNSLVLFSSAGPVDVSNREEFNNEGGYARLHNERGQAKPIILDTGEEITADIYLTTDYHAWAVSTGSTNCIQPHPENTPCAYPYWGWDAGAQPDFQVKATLYSAELGPYKGNASSQPPIEETLREGDPTVVAQGATEPELVSNGAPGTPRVLHFDVPLGTPQVSEIPKTHDFFVVYQFYSNSSGEQWSPHTWRIWGGEFYPPSFNMPVKNALSVENVIPRFAHGKLVFLSVVGSPWGSYDVDPEATTLTVEDADTGEQVTPDSIEAFSDYSVAHGGHFDPVNVTYVWDYEKDGLDPGTYEVTVTSDNIQGNSKASCTATFTVGPDGEPGATEPGICGRQTLSEERREELEEGAAGEAREGERLSNPDPLPGVTEGVLGALVLLVARPWRVRP